MTEKQEYVLLTHIHKRLKEKLREKYNNPLALLTPEMVEDILDDYYNGLLHAMEETLRRGYTVRVNGFFSLKVRVERIKGGFKHPYRVKGYVKFSPRFKKALLSDKGTSKYVVEVIGRENVR